MATRVTAKINFYNILECGYYYLSPRRHAFCSTQEMLLALSEWMKDKNIGETITFQPLEDSEQNKIYCYDICFEVKKGALLTTWNGYETTENNSIAAINAFAPIGTQDIKITEFTEGYIPGFPTYFWFPKNQEKVFATVLFDGSRLNGHSDMNRYLKGFLANSHPQYTYKTNAGEIVYKRTSSDNKEYSPHFASKTAKLPGPLQYIKGNWSRIKKLHQQMTLCPLIRSEDRALWQKWLKRLRLADHAVSEHEISFDSKIGWTPTQLELETIIEQWSNDSDSVGRMGVILAGESNKTYWFDITLATTKVEIDIEKNEHGIINAQSLLNALTRKQAQICAQAYKE